MLKRRHLAALLVLAWLGSLAWLVRREYATPADEGEVPATVRLSPTASFSGLWAASTQVGLLSVSTDTLADGLRITSRIDVDVPLPLVPRRLLGTTEALYDRRLRLLNFTTTTSGEAGQVTVTATRVGDSAMSVVISGRGLTAADTIELAVPEGAILADGVALALASRGVLEPGGAAEVTVLDPVELSVTRREVRIGAESTFVMPDSAAIDSVTGNWVPMGRDTVRALLVSWSEHGLPVRAWVDRRGGVLEQDTPLGLTQRRTPFEIVNSGYARRRPRNVQAAPLEVPAPVTESHPPERLSLGAVDLRGAAPALTTAWQRVVQGTLEPISGQGIGRLPAGPIPDSVRSAYLAPASSPFIASEARRIAGPELGNPAHAVERLARWIGSAIVAGPPEMAGADRALRRRRGDSSDRAALLVEMARTLGIPARPVAGLLTSGGRPRYRAWAEVWLGSWVPVDPTLSQLPADAGHYRLLVDATARPAATVTLLGAIRPDIITTSATP